MLISDWAEHRRNGWRSRTTRRVFLGRSAALLAAGACSYEGSGLSLAASTPPSRLVIARDPNLKATPAGLDTARLESCLDRAMQALYDCDTPLEAWRKVVHPGEVVGLKVNCLAGRGNSTRPELVNAICERLRQAGIQDIVIWDRLNSDLESAGFRVAERGSGLRCFGNDTLGYEDELAVFGSVGSLISKTLTEVCDAVINLPVLKDHGIAGVTIALKSLFGAIHNPNKYHMNVGNPYVADVYVLPPIRQKVRLHICDATTAQYEGGPSFMPHWTWPYNGLLVGHDPVALDYTGWQIIEKKRAEVGMKSLQNVKREPVYISTAADAEHALGSNDPRNIKLLEV